MFLLYSAGVPAKRVYKNAQCGAPAAARRAQEVQRVITSARDCDPPQDDLAYHRDVLPSLLNHRLAFLMVSLLLFVYVDNVY